MRYTPGSAKSDRSYASATFSSYLCEQMALLGSRDKTSRPPSALSLMTPWRDHSVHCGDQLLRSSPILLDKHFSALTPNMSWTDESFMCPVNPHLKKFYLFCIYIHQRIRTFRSVSVFQLADHVWRRVSSHGNKKKQGFVPVFPFDLPFSQNPRQENVFFHESQQDCAL